MKRKQFKVSVVVTVEGPANTTAVQAALAVDRNLGWTGGTPVYLLEVEVVDVKKP